MRSIDKLREWADGLRGIWLDPNDHSIIVTTCDDMVPSMDCVSLREHVNGILDGIEREVADMVPLPVDADGEPVHIGDVMEWCNGFFTVHELKLTEDGWQTWDSEHGYTAHADECIRHHHAPTVEDVLQEFTDEVWNRCCEGATASDSGIDELVAEYAAKLRLAGDE
ncbi:MAG: hypothetical protein IJJ14_07005 [Coriobacteriales bacterium]|nr:hypothetical protein [Coriobacteriales bacterium]